MIAPSEMVPVASFSPSALAREPGWDLHWQMSAAEAFTLQGILRKIQPELSLEIGTYEGGSLQVLSSFSKSVVSMDLNPEVARKLNGRFPNVQYLSGDSKILLPELVSELNRGAEALGFILVDGDHSSDGVRQDLNNLLQIVPKAPIVMLMHDSFNPDCRLGMSTANWNGSPYVHFVELDFVPGGYVHQAMDTAGDKTMWGGLACAVMLPTKRTGPLKIGTAHDQMHRVVYDVSNHRPRSFAVRAWRKAMRLLK